MANEQFMHDFYDPDPAVMYAKYGYDGKRTPHWFGAWYDKTYPPPPPSVTDVDDLRAMLRALSEGR